MLMIQKMQGYADNRQEMNRQTETICHFVVMGQVPSGRWCLMGLLGQRMGHGMHAWLT
jgi:hypothetical protein